MKITEHRISKKDVLLSENANEILIELGPKKYILRHRGDGVLVLITPESIIGDKEHPVRRIYFEPLRNGILIMQWIP